MVYHQNTANLRYTGWNENTNASFNALFDDNNLKEYQSVIHRLLKGAGPNGRDVIVPLETISSVLYQCYETRAMRTGDIYSRYIQADNINHTVLEDIVNRAINIIVTQIKTEYAMEEQNKRLTVWNTVLGDFNKEGLRGHSEIKLRNRRPPPMQFHMKY